MPHKSPTVTLEKRRKRFVTFDEMQAAYVEATEKIAEQMRSSAERDTERILVVHSASLGDLGSVTLQASADKDRAVSMTAFLARQTIKARRELRAEMDEAQEERKKKERQGREEWDAERRQIEAEVEMRAQQRFERLQVELKQKTPEG